MKIKAHYEDLKLNIFCFIITLNEDCVAKNKNTIFVFVKAYAIFSKKIKKGFW